MKFLAKIFSFLTLVGVGAGVAVLYVGLQNVENNVQEVSTITFAVALPMLPYFFSKALEDLAKS